MPSRRNVHTLRQELYFPLLTVRVLAELKGTEGDRGSGFSGGLRSFAFPPAGGLFMAIVISHILLHCVSNASFIRALGNEADCA